MARQLDRKNSQQASYGKTWTEITVVERSEEDCVEGVSSTTKIVADKNQVHTLMLHNDK